MDLVFCFFFFKAYPLTIIEIFCFRHARGIYFDIKQSQPEGSPLDEITVHDHDAKPPAYDTKPPVFDDSKERARLNAETEARLKAAEQRASAAESELARLSKEVAEQKERLNAAEKTEAHLEEAAEASASRSSPLDEITVPKDHDSSSDSKPPPAYTDDY